MNSDLSTLDARFRPYAEWLVRVAALYGLRPQVTSVRRSVQLQAQLYADYLAGRSLLPAAPPGSSKHNYGLAFDMTVMPPAYLGSLGALWRQIGGEWSSSDPVHFAAPG